MAEREIAYDKCDVVERTLLSLAGLEVDSSVKCQFVIGSDVSRLVFKFTGMQKALAEKLHVYFKEQGDETVTMDHGGRMHSSCLPEGLELQSYFEQSGECYINPRSKNEVETHSIAVDGLFFYQQIFPLLKGKINEMEVSSLRSILDEYRKKSECHFPAKTSPDVQQGDNLMLEGIAPPSFR